MKIGILPVSFVVLVLSENMLLGAPTNRSGTSNSSSAKLVATSTAKSYKIINFTTTPAKRFSSTTKKNAAIVSKGITGKMTTTLRTTTQKKKNVFTAGKTTTQKFAYLKDPRRTTTPSRTSMKPTIKTPFGTIEESFYARPYPTSRGNKYNQPAQPYDIPGVMFSAPFFPGHVSEDYENPFVESADTAVNVTTTAVVFQNVTTRDEYGIVTEFKHGNLTRTEFPLPLEEGAYYRITAEPDMNTTLTTSSTIRKRLKRKKTTVGAELTTRKRLKRKRTTTVPSSSAPEEYQYEEY